MEFLKAQAENNCCVPVIENGEITCCNPFDGCVAGCCTPFFACLSKVVEVAAKICNIKSEVAVDLPDDRSSTDSITFTVSEHHEKTITVKVGESDEE